MGRTIPSKLSRPGFIGRFTADEGGATAIEYALMASLIALVIVTAVTGAGTSLKGAFNNIANTVK